VFQKLQPQIKNELQIGKVENVFRIISLS
jgi:hypothetical protein